MVGKDGQRMLCYPVVIDDIIPIVGSDNCACAVIGGWKVMVKKGQFQKGQKVVYFEVDSLVPADNEAFTFMSKYKYKVKTQRYTFGGKGLFFSQGLILAFVDLGLKEEDYEIHTDLTKKLGVKYYEVEDNQRKANFDPYRSMMDRHKKFFRKPWVKKIMRYAVGRKIMFTLFGKKKDNKKGWPVGQFPGVSKTDQERVECMPFVLNDKTPYIVSQKCDGSSGTFILERKKFGKYEFYVCSRNVRMLHERQECFYGADNYYWEVAKKYDIENKMKQWLKENPTAKWICWQGEICAPGIQKNPHKLTETHLFCFHWTDSINGRLDLITAKKEWEKRGMEVVPITDTNFILPNDMETFKLQADGFYDASVCEGKTDCAREGFVYYKTTDPTFSFKNVSRTYLLKH